MNNHLLVSIVTPSYNQGQFLEESILSVLNQDYKSIEYIVIDGSSTDESLDIIHRYEKELAYWESEPDRGQSHAINKGLKRATGEILGWLNSDDVLLPSTVSRAMAAFDNHPDVDVVYGRLNRIDSWGHLLPTPLLPKDVIDFNRKTVIGENLVNSAGAFWRRRIMERVGLLNEGLHYVMDYEYWVRMVLAGAKFERLDGEPVANFRIGAHAKTVSQLEKSALEALALHNEFAANPSIAATLSLSPAEYGRRLRKVRAHNSLRAFYGCVRQEARKVEALRWLIRGALLWPPALFQKRWFQLALARAKRQVHHPNRPGSSSG